MTEIRQLLQYSENLHSYALVLPLSDLEGIRTVIEEIEALQARIKLLLDTSKIPS